MVQMSVQPFVMSASLMFPLYKREGLGNNPAAWELQEFDHNFCRLQKYFVRTQIEGRTWK